MPKFRKKPVVIEARRLESPETPDSIAEWCDGTVRGRVADASGPLRVEIDTLEGVMSAIRGDWIIKGVKGEFYPCKPDVFAATYEPVEEPTQKDEPTEKAATFGLPDVEIVSLTTAIRDAREMPSAEWVRKWIAAPPQDTEEPADEPNVWRDKDGEIVGITRQSCEPLPQEDLDALATLEVDEEPATEATERCVWAPPEVDGGMWKAGCGWATFHSPDDVRELHGGKCACGKPISGEDTQKEEKSRE